MKERIDEFTEEEKALVIKYLRGLAELHRLVSGSGAGPLSRLIMKIKRTQPVIKFDYFELEGLLRHLKGARGYNTVVHGSDPLNPLIKKIDGVLHPRRTSPRLPHLTRRRTDGQ